MSSSEVVNIKIVDNENRGCDANRAPKGRHASKLKDMMASMDNCLIGVETSLSDTVQQLD